MSKSDVQLRGQISKLEGSLKSARDKNSKDSSKKKDLEVNYADMTLVLADVSNKMDSDRFEVKYNEQQNRKSANEESQASDKNQNTLTNEEFCDIEPYEDVDDNDSVPYPSMKRFGAPMPTLNETESQIDLRDFNDLEAPEAAANPYTEYKQGTDSGYTRDLSSDRGDDEDTPQQEYKTGLSASYPLAFDYSRENSEEYDAHTADTDYGKPTALFRNRTRSKTLADNPFKGTNAPNKSSRSYSQTDPSIQVSFEEHYYTEDTQTYAKPSLVQIRDSYKSEPTYDDNYPADYNQLEDSRPNTLSPLSLNLIGSVSSNHSDSDSDFDNFINQRQEGNPQPVEEMRAKSPYFQQQPASKSALGSYAQVEKSLSPHPPEVAMRQKSRNQEQHKRLTMPQTAPNYEVPAVNNRKSPNPYSKYKISTANPTDGKLLFRSFQSARDASPYDTVLSSRKVSTPNYGPSPPQQDPETEAYQEEERHASSRQPSVKANFNRNKSTNHRNYVSHPRQEIVSPTSPPMEVEYDDDIPYETTVNAAEIMGRHPQSELASPHHYAVLHHSAPRPVHRQQPVPRNIYAAPHTGSVTPANRNHAYVSNHDTSPVQSLDSGIASLYNDISYRPRTAAAQVSYHNNEFDYGEAPVEDEPNMEELVLQLRNELRLLSSKIQRFEDQSVAPTPVPTQQVMSPTGQKYPVYQLRSGSAASSGSEGGRAKQGPQSPKITSPNMSRSPLPVQATLPPRHPQQSQQYGTEYATPPSTGNKDRAVGIPQSNRIKKQLIPQSSTPNINRPSSVSKFASNSSQSRISNGIPRPVPPPIRPVQNRPQVSNVPRAQSSTGTATYTSLPTPRLQTPRYTPGPQIHRSTSPLPPKTSARKTVPPRPTHSSRSNRGPDGYHYDEESLKQPSHIPNPNQRYHY